MFVPAFLIVAVPPVPPITIVFAAPSTFALVTVALSKLNVVAVEVMSPPFTAMSPPAVTSPIRVDVPVTERVLLVESAPWTTVAPVTVSVPFMLVPAFLIVVVPPVLPIFIALPDVVPMLIVDAVLVAILNVVALVEMPKPEEIIPFTLIPEPSNVKLPDPAKAPLLLY